MKDAPEPVRSDRIETAGRRSLVQNCAKIRRFVTATAPEQAVDGTA